jgi:hypothetical protein
MLIQYPIDAVPENSANGRGLWILHQAEKKQQRESGKAKTFFDWDKKSRLRISLHKFAARNVPMDSDGLANAFKPIRDGIVEGLNDYFKQVAKSKFKDGNESLFFFQYSQSKATEPIFADTIIVTIDLMPADSPYKGDTAIVKRWGYTPILIDRASLIATLGELRAAKISEISNELKRSRAGTKKVDKLKKELSKTQKAIAYCIAKTVFGDK